MMILRRLLAILVLLIFGLLLVPTLVLFGQRGVDRLDYYVDPVMDWAGLFQ